MYSQIHRNFDKSSALLTKQIISRSVSLLLSASVHLIHLHCADLTEADIDQGEAELLEAVHCPEHHRGRGHAEMTKIRCQRT